METKDLEYIIEMLNEALELMADIDLYNQGIPQTRKLNQKKIIKSFDILFRTRKRLNFYKDLLEGNENE